MKTYNVAVCFSGCIYYDVKAENEAMAKKQAEALFEEENDTIVVSEIAECKACNCYEREIF